MAVWLTYKNDDGSISHRAAYETEDEALAQAVHDLETGHGVPLEIRDEASENVLVSHTEIVDAAGE